MHNDIEKIYVSEEEINEMLNRLGNEIKADYKDKNPLIIGLLKGCLPFMSDLVKKLDFPLTLNYIKASSYKGIESTGFITIEGKVPDVAGRDVIVIDDILDTGRTLDSIRRVLIEHGANSVELCVLLDKPDGRKFDIKAKYVGGPVPNEFVVGYGLDFNEHYRNLPYIGVLKPEVYQK